MMSEVRSDETCAPDKANYLDATPPPQTWSMANNGLLVRQAHRSSRRVSIAARKKARDGKRLRHGKYWDSNFFQYRSTADGPLSDQCDRIFGSPDYAFQGHKYEDGVGEEHADDEHITEGEDPVPGDDERKGVLAPTTDNVANCNTAMIDPDSPGKQDVNSLISEELTHLFLEDWEGSTPSWEAKVVRRFFSREDDESSTEQDSKAWAWLDDREYSTGRSGEYGTRLSAIELHATLNQPVLSIAPLEEVS